MKILFTGGGTGGHIFPIIAICREIKKMETNQNFEFFYIGPEDDLSSLLLPKEGIKVKTVMAGKVRRYWEPKSTIQNLIDILIKIPIGTLQALFYIFFLGPDIIFSKGGYGSLPAVIAGWLLQTPIFLHESDAAPGLANRITSKLALEIFVSFPVSKTEYFNPKKIISVGNPIRKDLLGGSPKEGKVFFRLTLEKPTILILGGSQGSQRINDTIISALPDFVSNFEIIHQVGQRNFKQVKDEIKVLLREDLNRYYHVFPFLRETELKYALAAADIIISRAGAGTIFEIAAMGKPSILIPLPESAQCHQVKNAYAYADTGAAIVIEETNLTPHFLLEKLKYLSSHKKELEYMSVMAKFFSRPKAAKIIASYIVEYLK